MKNILYHLSCIVAFTLLFVGETVAQTSCATAVNITVKSKNVDCFTGYTPVMTTDIGANYVPAGTCATSGDDDWWGTFTATDTKTEFYLWGKGDINAQFIVYSGACGSLTSIMCQTSGSSKAIPMYGSVTTVPGQTYYILIHQKMEPGRLCVYSQVVEPTKTFCTADMSFESGSDASWISKNGAYHLVSAPGTTFMWDMPFTTKPAGRFQLTTGAGVDPFVGGILPVVAPGGGNYSYRIGNNTGNADLQPAPNGSVPGNHASAESMSYCFTVNSANAGFGYKYAVVIDYSAHPAELQPLFEAFLVVQSTGDTIQCGKYSHFAGDGKSPFKFVGDDGDVASQSDGTIFTPWTDVITDLSGYVGQTVCATFRVRDCEGGNDVSCCPYTSGLAGGTHWAYAYFDTYCIPINITTPEFCAGAASIQICAPPGYATYSWPAGQPGLTGSPTTQCVTINNPVAGTVYTVNMTSILGCAVTAKVTISNIPITVTAPSSICTGNPATITVAPTNSTNPPYTFTWSHGLGTGDSKTVTPASTTTYTVTVQNGSGCTATQEIVINVSTCTNVTATITPATVCNGSCGTITASGSGGTIPYSFSWSTGASTSAITPCPTSTTTYSVTVTDNFGSTATATAQITVTPAPTITVGNVSICTGGSTPLTANGGTTYTWSPGTGLSSTTGTTVTANPAVTTTYTVVGSTSGCTGSTTVVVTVGALVPNAGSNVTICPGTSTTLNASGGSGYSWTPVTGLSDPTIFNPVANPTTTTTYTVTVTSGSCTGTASVVVTVETNPTVTVPSVSICSGNSTTLTAGGASTYTWAPTTGLGSGSGTTVTASPTVTTTYTVIGTSVGGCTGSTTVVVTVTPGPTISGSGGITCANISISLTAGGADSYTWIPATGLSGSTGSTVSAGPATTTTYTVTGTSAATGCTGSTTVIVTVLPSPVADFTISPTGIVPPNKIVTFTDISTNPGSPVWNFGDPTSGTDNISTLTSPTHTYTDEGDYCITLTSTNTSSGCSDTVTKCIVVIGEAVIIFPNVFTPNGDGNNDIFYFYTKGVKGLKCTIYDRWGLKMYEWDTVTGGWDGRAKSGKPAPDGVYYFIMEANPSNEAELIKKQGFLQLIRER